MQENQIADNPHNESNDDDDVLLSPSAMAEAALADGVKDRKRRDSEKVYLPTDKLTTDDNTRQEKDGAVSLQCLKSQDGANDDGDVVINRSEVTTKKRKMVNSTVMATMQKDNCMASYDLLLDKIWSEVGNGAVASGIAQTKVNDINTSSTDGRKLPQKIDIALNETKYLLYRQIDAIIQAGLESFHESDTMARELSQVKELSGCRGREVRRLTDDLRASRASLSVSARFLSK